MRPTLRERVFSRLVIDQETGCLLWTGEVGRNGYGKITTSGRRPYVHRLMYEWFVGPIPDGLQIDHLCRVRNCASPAHLEAVTHAENMRRSRPYSWRRAITHCPQGHPYDQANTNVGKRGDRRCKACSNARNRIWYAKRTARR